ncbi:hypothetical protein ARMGADRAFT_616015 [Armillaria gallica]|uniref:Uncharacterized protein n=1 Tax=Armillaria gallica TaxID=47427 RepID=A0A2H3CZS2_ARMGA|nr:hypothetical protein ARMGADRAFT_616015 [Armillaria gallica]
MPGGGCESGQQRKIQKFRDPYSDMQPRTGGSLLASNLDLLASRLSYSDPFYENFLPLSSNHTSSQNHWHQPQYIVPRLRHNDSTHCVPASEIQGHVEMAKGTGWRGSHRRMVSLRSAMIDVLSNLGSGFVFGPSKSYIADLIRVLNPFYSPSVCLKETTHRCLASNQFFCLEFASHVGGKDTTGWVRGLKERMFLHINGPDIDHFLAITCAQYFPSHQLSALNVAHDLLLQTYALSRVLLRNAPPVTHYPL